MLAEEWLALRKAGRATPQIAIWQNLQGDGGNLWREYIEGEYADPAYKDLIFADEASGNSKVMFATEAPNQTVVAEIEGRGFRVVTMWALHREFAQGAWSFFSPCTDALGAFTSSVPLRPGARCNQYVTRNAPIGMHGTAITVSPSYQLSYSSLPFRASGKLGGLTLRKQFETAFEAHAEGRLDYLMVAAFNEHIAQLQHNPFNPPHAGVHSMGMGADPAGAGIWVDMYGDGIARDMEPTVEAGSTGWDLLRSCLRVFHSGAAQCTNTSEVCCDAAMDPAGQWDNVFVLRSPPSASAADLVLTTDDEERAELLARNYSEVCTGLGGSAAFCNYPDVNDAAYPLGPFLIHRLPLLPPATSSPVHRCVAAAGGYHFYSLDAGCRRAGRLETVLGYASHQRSTETPRSLRLCQAAPSGDAKPPASWALPPLYHSVDAACLVGDLQLEYLGHVR